MWWENSFRGRWTLRLVPDTAPWMENEYFRRSFYVMVMTVSGSTFTDLDMITPPKCSKRIEENEDASDLDGPGY